MVFKYCINSVVLFVCLGASHAAWAESSAKVVRDGNVFYKQGKYEDALKDYSKAVTLGGQDPVARYNLGNALYRKGKSQEDSNIDGAIADLEQSVGSYKQVLKANAKDEDAKYNLDFVGKELERLKKKKEEQKKQEQQKQDKEDKKDKQGQDKQEKDQQKQDKQDKDSQSKDQQKSDREKADQQQQDQQQKQGDQDKDKQDKEKQDRESQDKKQQKDQQQKQEQKQGEEQGKAQEMSSKEAKDILEDYQRNEEPKGLLNFIRKSNDEKPVLKDW